MFRTGSMIGLAVGGVLCGLAAVPIADSSDLGGATVPCFAVFGAFIGWILGHGAPGFRPSGGSGAEGPGQVAERQAAGAVRGWPAEFTALQEAARGGHLERVRELLDAGVDQNFQPGLPKGWSPLMYAAHEGHAEVARLLADRGASVNFACGDSCTAVTLAAGAGHWEVVKLLAARGGDVSHMDCGGISALGAAEGTGDAALAASLRGVPSGGSLGNT